MTRYFFYKDLFPSIQKLHNAGGKFQLAAQTVYSIIGRLKGQNNQSMESDILKDYKLTKNGESRIDKCIKYDLSGKSRLITIQDNGIVIFCYAGNHVESDKWLDGKKGLKLSVDEKFQLEEVWESKDIKDKDLRISRDTDWSNGPLVQRISVKKYDKISQGIPFSLLKRFEVLTSISTEDDILELCYEIDDSEQAHLFYDIFNLLKVSDVDGAKKRIDLYLNKRVRVEELSKEDIQKIVEGESFIEFENFDGELIGHLMKTTNYKQWMLFMHPEQKKIVEKDFNGPAKLYGVSGSGKTVVLIKRAIRLAQKYEGEKILVLTLNRSLAQLIEELINEACPETPRKRIYVKSFWNLCQELLLRFEPDHGKLYTDNTVITNEHVDDIWREYYFKENNNSDAEIFFPVHKSLLGRGIYAYEYLKQEFDWIRSALAPKERDNYMSIQRDGRAEPLDKQFRQLLLKGLNCWEEKMNWIGVIDYLGLATALIMHLDKIIPEYRCILVDEEQDFGTIEYKIIRKLVSESDNDIFICGDYAQKVYSKQHSLKSAGINIIGRSSFIKKNYRNSKEILSAAYDVYEKNIVEEAIENEEFELIKPEYANFSNSKPLLLKADNLKQEIGFAYYFTKNMCEPDKKACIAICGFSLQDIRKIGEQLKLQVLDGSISIESNNMFLSDLEQTKGFEFDFMCILNCNKNIVPNVNLPIKESYRDLSKLYVAMTRAKLQLFLSYSTELSSFFENSKEYFSESHWNEYEENYELKHLVLPVFSTNERDSSLLLCTGSEFLYKKQAVGLSIELQEKLEKIITGKNVFVNGKQTEWRNISDALRETNIPNIAQLFGTQKTWPEFLTFFSKLDKKR